MIRVALSHRFLVLSALFAFACAGQTGQTVSFRVSTNPAGARFSVDGQIYTSAAVFQWPAGSQHIVSFVQDVPQNVVTTPSTPTLNPWQLIGGGDAVYTFNGWVDSNGLLLPSKDPTQFVTADPSIPSLTANLVLNYRVLLSFYDNPPATLPASCGAPGPATSGGLVHAGVVYVSQQCYWNNAVLYFPANQKIIVNAFPYPGFVFLGWQGSNSDAYLNAFTLTGPITLAPRFSPAKRVRFVTNPLALQVLVDRTVTPTVSSSDPSMPCPDYETLPVTTAPPFTPLCRGDFDFAPGSAHLVGAPTPQTDKAGTTWIFDSWGSGNGQNAVYTADQQTAVSDQVVVNFVRGAQASFVTNPPGLKLSIDGRSNWPGYNFVWALGSTHQVSAPTQQYDAAGRSYSLSGWSNGGSANQSIVVDQTAVTSGFRIIANYSVLSRVVVQTSPPGQKIQIDGADCQSPCAVDRSNGSTIRVAAPGSIQVSDSIRMDLASWSDGGAPDHQFTIGSDFQTLTASYVTLYRVATGSDPANGAIFHLDPASPDTFYPSDTQLSVSVEAKPGFKFRRWGGDLSGTYPAGTLAVSGPRSAMALMDRVPYIAPAGVTNSVGQTPAAAVAPGSLIAITGESLAPDTVQGRTNPLAQTLDNVTVTIGDRLLALVSVSPQQIIAQVPSDLQAGDYTLQVHSTGQPDVTSTFTIARNAPGLYTQALHSDGSNVSADSPAVRGETITIFGTGFGPYATPVIDGFVQQDPAPALADPVDLLIADQTLQPAWCGAAVGQTGLVALKVTIADPIPSAQTVDLKVRVNGVLSNTIQIPMQ